MIPAPTLSRRVINVRSYTTREVQRLIGLVRRVTLILHDGLSYTTADYALSSCKISVVKDKTLHDGPTPNFITLLSSCKITMVAWRRCERHRISLGNLMGNKTLPAPPGGSFQKFWKSNVGQGGDPFLVQVNFGNRLRTLAEQR